MITTKELEYQLNEINNKMDNLINLLSFQIRIANRSDDLINAVLAQIIDDVSPYHRLQDIANHSKYLEFDEEAQKLTILCNLHKKISFKVIGHNIDRYHTITLMADKPVSILEWSNININVSYKNSSIRQWLNNDFYNELPDIIQKSIIPVSKSVKNVSSDDESVYDKIWLLSKHEVLSDILYDKTQMTGYDDFWTRNNRFDSDMVYCVNSNGNICTNKASLKLGVVPCFVIKV